MKKEMHITALAKELNISTPVTLKHAKILEEVGFIERQKMGNTHVLAVKHEAVGKIKKAWGLFEKSLVVNVPKGTTMLDALKKVSGLEFVENSEGSFITSVDGKEGHYIYEVNGKLPNVPADKFTITKNAEVELKRMMPIIGKKIQIKVE